MSFYRLLIGWTNNVREGTADYWKAKGEANMARTHIFQWSSLIYQMFEVCKSHCACRWLIFKGHNKTICSLLWLLCPVLLWPTLRPIWNLHGIGQWSQMLRKLNIQETLGKHVPCEKCNCTVHITTVEQNLEDVWLFLKLQKLFSFQNLFLLP